MPLIMPHGLPSLPYVLWVLLQECLRALFDALCSSAIFHALARSIGF